MLGIEANEHRALFKTRYLFAEELLEIQKTLKLFPLPFSSFSLIFTVFYTLPALLLIKIKIFFIG